MTTTLPSSLPLCLKMNNSNSGVMQDWLFQDVCKCATWPGSWCGLMVAIVSSVAVFIVCSGIDYIRQMAIEKPLFCILNKKFGI